MRSKVRLRRAEVPETRRCGVLPVPVRVLRVTWLWLPGRGGAIDESDARLMPNDLTQGGMRRYSLTTIRGHADTTYR